MKINIYDQKKAKIQSDMIGLFFEDINYAADGGLYAEMIENRSFEFVDCYGEKGDYYTIFDGGYGWELYPKNAAASMRIVTGSPLAEENPHYMRFVAKDKGAGFSNKAYDGIYMKAGLPYNVSFYARNAKYEGNYEVSVRKDGKVVAKGIVESIKEEKEALHRWNKYELSLVSDVDTEGADFVITLCDEGTVEFDLISMFPSDAVAGIFRKDLFEKLKDLHPGFIRFPGGCIIEGNTLDNRYRYKESLKPVEHRKWNWSRWAVFEYDQKGEMHGPFSHYNQSLGMGYYEFFLLCELLGAKPLPVLNVGLACQFQSYELVEPESEEFKEFLQDALDLIEFANGDTTTKYGAVRAALGHPEPFALEMVGIGNEQWETKESRFFERYTKFEEMIHDKYPEIRLIGSAGPDITSEKYENAWRFIRESAGKKDNFVYAVDEHYYVKPEWFYEHTDFYDEYPREVKVFSGEYAAHPAVGFNNPAGNTLGGALAEAAFLTGVERNADVVVLASYAPLFARMGYTQWSPDMIWFDAKSSYGTPSYYVQKLFSEYKGTTTLDTKGQEKELIKENVYYNTTMDEETGETYLKIVNANEKDIDIELQLPEGSPLKLDKILSIGGKDKDVYNNLSEPENISLKCEQVDESANTIKMPANTFAVVCMKK